MRGRVSREQLAFSFDEPMTALPYTLVCDDVLKWAETYTGPKFHCLLTDAPYHLQGVIDPRVRSGNDENRGQAAAPFAARGGFMNQRWDGGDIAFKPETWKALAQHLLPGAFIMAFGSSRGWHRLACAMEDAGLRIMPSIFNWRTGETHDIGMYGWASGSSFPKATRIDAVLEKQRHDYPAIKQLVLWIREAASREGYNAERINHELGWGVAVADHFLKPSESNAGVPTWEQWLQLKALLQLSDEMDAEVWRLNGRKGQPGEAWVQREVIGQQTKARKTDCGIALPTNGETEYQTWDLTAPATPLAQTWAGHRYGGQVLKNSLEPIIVAQVPYAGKPVESIVKHGSGALWIDGGRVGTESTVRPMTQLTSKGFKGGGFGNPDALGHRPLIGNGGSSSGRWPPNFVLQHVSIPVSRLKGHLPPDTQDAIMRYYDGYTEVSTLRAGRNGAVHHGLEVLAGDIPEGWLEYFERTGEDLGCVAQGTRQVKASGVSRSFHSAYEGTSNTGFLRGNSHPGNQHDDGHGRETIPAYQCHESCVVRKLDLQAGPRNPPWLGGKSISTTRSWKQSSASRPIDNSMYQDGTAASRFFQVSDWSLDVAEHLAQADPAYYAAKESSGYREEGLLGHIPCLSAHDPDIVHEDNPIYTRRHYRRQTAAEPRIEEDGSITYPVRYAPCRRNGHPTVKPLKLTQWLATLLLPPAAYAPRRLLNVFSGSGSEGIGALLAGWDEIVMVDSDQSYVDIAEQRLTYWSAHRGDTR